MALSAATATDRGALEQAATAALARLALVELGRLGQLRDGQNAPFGSAIPVRVEQHGGPRWAGTVLQTVAARDPTVTPTPDGQHVLSIDLLDNRREVVLVLRLRRKGWELRNPWPLRMGVVPELALVASFLGALFALVTGRSGGGWLLAGGLSQAGAALLARAGPVFPSGPWWARNPVARAVIEGVRAAPDWTVSMGFVIGLGCAGWVGWDVLRTRSPDGRLSADMLGRVVLVTIGVAAWSDAAGRTGWWPWLSTGWGWLGLGAVVAVWIAARTGGRHAR